MVSILPWEVGSTFLLLWFWFTSCKEGLCWLYMVWTLQSIRWSSMMLSMASANLHLTNWWIHYVQSIRILLWLQEIPLHQFLCPFWQCKVWWWCFVTFPHGHWIQGSLSCQWFFLWFALWVWFKVWLQLFYWRWQWLVWQAKLVLQWSEQSHK